MVIIGIDPHKATHTAVAVDEREVVLGKLEVRATSEQRDRLLCWAARFEERTWAVESAGGLGELLARQLVDAGEHVIDVPPTLSARVRLLGSGKSSKKRSQRCALDGDRSAAPSAASGCGRRRSRHRDPVAGGPASRPRSVAHAVGVPAAPTVVHVDAGRSPPPHVR